MLKRALLRDGQTGVWLDFQTPFAVLEANEPADVLPLLARVDAYCRQGGYAAGYLTFEAAAGIDSAYRCHESAAQPLVIFGLFGAPVLRPEPMPQTVRQAVQPDWLLAESFEEYRAKLDRIHQEIGAGNLYQVNHTVRLRADGVAPEQLFAHAAREAIYGAWLELEGARVVSASPELFFRLDGRDLTSLPMKGTIARGRTEAEDEANRLWLFRSEKNRAENLMITDMVRNDVGRIALPGSVQTERIFEIHPLPTVWQMTSTVRAVTDAPLGEIFRGLYPAASITGAPKVASMSLIRELEEDPRGIYTGAIGFVGPAASGLRAQFSVAIRTAWVDVLTGRGCYGAGGGIVWDSSATEEYAEVQLKARILKADHQQPDLQPPELLETLGWSPESGYDYLEAHLTRLDRAARFYDVCWNREQVIACLQDAEVALRGESGERWRVRLVVDQAGRAVATTHLVDLDADAVQPVMLAKEPVCGSDPELRHKTTRRGIYERASASVPEGVEALLWNAEGLVTETAIANLVYELDGGLFTPPESDGLLPGVLRGVLLQEGRVRERSLPVTELATVQGLFLVNALRGWRRAELR